MSLPWTEVPMVSTVSVWGRGPESEGASGPSSPQLIASAATTISGRSQSHVLRRIIVSPQCGAIGTEVIFTCHRGIADLTIIGCSCRQAGRHEARGEGVFEGHTLTPNRFALFAMRPYPERGEGTFGARSSELGARSSKLEAR